MVVQGKNLIFGLVGLGEKFCDAIGEKFHVFGRISTPEIKWKILCENHAIFFPVGQWGVKQ